jgi:hypothetical protein
MSARAHDDDPSTAAFAELTVIRRHFMNIQCGMPSYIGIALLFATASFAQQVKTDYDRNADFELKRR